MNNVSFTEVLESDVIQYIVQSARGFESPLSNII